MVVMFSLTTMTANRQKQNNSTHCQRHYESKGRPIELNLLIYSEYVLQEKVAYDPDYI